MSTALFLWISADLTLMALNSLIFNINSIISADFNVIDIKICKNNAVDVKSKNLMSFAFQMFLDV